MLGLVSFRAYPRYLAVGWDGGVFGPQGSARKVEPKELNRYWELHWAPRNLKKYGLHFGF
jgi:hypothetical protein